jgi:hypothetical protein
MCWDAKKRGHAGGYYYRSFREAGRVRKVYVGRGPQAEEAARQVEQRRQARQAEREARLQEQTRLAGAEQRLHDLRTLADALVRATLHAAGFHRHHGTWRKRRHARDGHTHEGDQHT